MDKGLDKDEFEAKKKKIKDRWYEIDELIHSFDEVDDKFSRCLIDLINITTGALDDFKCLDVTRKRELLNFVFQNLQLRGKNSNIQCTIYSASSPNARNLKNGGGGRI
jgi:hypothetical protein